MTYEGTAMISFTKGKGCTVELDGIWCHAMVGMAAMALKRRMLEYMAQMARQKTLDKKREVMVAAQDNEVVRELLGQGAEDGRRDEGRDSDAGSGNGAD